MLHTRMTGLVGCRRPLQLAAMPGVATPALAIAVAGAGALAMLPAAGVPLALFRKQLDEVRAATDAPIGVNFLIPFLDCALLEVAAASARVVEFFYGAPDRALVDTVHRGGALACWQIGSTGEAHAAVDAGCDLIVAQGVEAGGHVRGQVGLLALLDDVLDKVQVPVLAAGGIGTARSVAAALSAGAAGVRIGTRFVTTFESGAHPAYVDALLRARAEDTFLTETFSVMWPNAPHRVLRSCAEAALALEEDSIGETLHGDLTLPMLRLAVPVPTVHTTGHVHAMALYAGQSVSAVHRVQPAAEVVGELCDGAEQILRRTSEELLGAATSG